MGNRDSIGEVGRSVHHNYLPQGVDSTGGEDTGSSSSFIGGPGVENLSGILMIITMVMMTMIAMVVEVVDGDHDHN